MTLLNRRYTYDNSLLLKDAGLVAASGNATVGGSAKILDVGTARIDSRAIVDATAIESATGDEMYTVVVQGSNSSSFANTIVNLGEQKLGAAAVTGASAAETPGRYEIPFTNEQNGVIYQYIRIRILVVGTIATGINFTAYLPKA